MDDSATIIIGISCRALAQRHPSPWLRPLCMLGKKQYIVVHHLIAGCTRKQVFFQGLQFLHTLEPHTLLLSSHALKTSKGPQKRALRGEQVCMKPQHRPRRFIYCYSPKLTTSVLNHSPHPARGANSCPAQVLQSWSTWSLDFPQMALRSNISLNYLCCIHPHDPIQLHTARQGSHTGWLG